MSKSKKKDKDYGIGTNPLEALADYLGLKITRGDDQAREVYFCYPKEQEEVFK